MELLDAVTRPVMLAEGVHLFDPSDMTYHNLKVVCWAARNKTFLKTRITNGLLPYLCIFIAVLIFAIKSTTACVCTSSPGGRPRAPRRALQTSWSGLPQQPLQAVPIALRVT